jgi:O-succinylhomoserine sulfhydrylase
MSELDTYEILTAIDDSGGSNGPIAPPIYQTSTFWASGPDEFLEMATEPKHPAFYTRYGNPTTRLFENAVARLEGAEAALATASGMAAVTAAILTFVGQGQRVLAQSALYGGTMGSLAEYCTSIRNHRGFLRPGEFRGIFAATQAGHKIDPP